MYKRQGVGISEVSDSLTIIVSEETGRVSVAQHGRLIVGVNREELKAILLKEQNANAEKQKRKIWKGWVKKDVYKRQGQSSSYWLLW